MFGIGGTELLVILVVALLVLGPKKLPELARTLGKAMGEFRKVSTDFQRTLNTEIAIDDEVSKKSDAVTSAQKTDLQEQEISMEEIPRQAQGLLTDISPDEKKNDG